MTEISEVRVEPKMPWSAVIELGKTLTITDLEGQQAVDFLCYDADDLTDRFSATNTIKVQGNIYIKEGSVLRADSGKPLFAVVKDTVGRHDTIYGCCSNPNNMLRYGVETTESCYTNFEAELARWGMARDAIVPNVNWFMSVPVLENGSAGVAKAELKPGSFVSLRAECNVLAVLSNCPQMHNPCNGYNLSPIKVSIA